MDKSYIEKIVREILEKQLEINSDNMYEEANGVIKCKFNQLKPQPFDTGKAGDDVKIIDAFSLEQSKRLGCGLMEMKETTFPWTLSYDEIIYVIEGVLEIHKEGKKVTAKVGEVIHTPAGSSIHFCVPHYAKFMYVTYPANWAE